MASIVGASNALEMRLAELAAFGLGRPANVLFSEYVTVLVARGVIDAATAERLSIGFYAARYGDPKSRGPGRLRDDRADGRRDRSVGCHAGRGAARIVRTGPARLANHLGERGSLGDHASADSRRASVGERPPLGAADGLWDAEPLAERICGRGAVSVGGRPLGRFGLEPARRTPPQDFPRRCPAVALFFAGYASYSPVEKVRASVMAGRQPPPGRPAPSKRREKPRVVESQPPKEAIHRNLAVSEARLQNDQKASQAYELHQAYQPEDAQTLNNFAWLYLTTKDPAVHNPQRGFRIGDTRHHICVARLSFLTQRQKRISKPAIPKEAMTLENEALEQTQVNAPVSTRGLEINIAAVSWRSLKRLASLNLPPPPRRPDGPAPTKVPAPTKAPARTPPRESDLAPHARLGQRRGARTQERRPTGEPLEKSACDTRVGPLTPGPSLARGEGKKIAEPAKRVPRQSLARSSESRSPRWSIVTSGGGLAASASASCAYIPCFGNTVVTRGPQIFLTAVRIRGLSSIST